MTRARTLAEVLARALGVAVAVGGAVGAALDDAASWCGIIVDGVHVHPASLRVALNAKPRGKVFLVTDAMPMDIVHGFEAIQVNRQDGERALGALGCRNLPLQELIKQRPVTEPSQGIVVSKMTDMRQDL